MRISLSVNPQVSGEYHSVINREWQTMVWIVHVLK